MNSPHEQWLTEIFEEFESPLLSYTIRFVRRHDVAQDVVQDAFLRLCDQDPEQLGTSTGAWLDRVCRNRALDVVKKEKRMQRMEVDGMSTNSPNPTVPGRLLGHGQETPDPAQVALQRDEASWAARALRSLSSRQQEVVRLKLEHGLSYQEIGDVLGLTASNVGYILHHSLKALRQQLTT